MSINSRIIEVRHSMNLSQSEFATALNISNVHIANIEMERRNASESLVKAVSEKYNVNESWLKTGRGKMFNASYYTLKHIEDAINPK